MVKADIRLFILFFILFYFYLKQRLAPPVYTDAVEARQPNKKPKTAVLNLYIFVYKGFGNYLLPVQVGAVIWLSHD